MIKIIINVLKPKHNKATPKPNALFRLPPFPLTSALLLLSLQLLNRLFMRSLTTTKPSLSLLPAPHWCHTDFQRLPISDYLWKQPFNEPFYRVISPRSFGGTNFSFMTITIRSSCISVLLFTQADIPEGQMWDSMVVTVVTTEQPRPALHGLGMELRRSGDCSWKTRCSLLFFFFFPMYLFNLANRGIFGVKLRGASRVRSDSVGTI